ncbi:exported protein of unknown function [Acetoanaerobium sticklandii]|uniref:DUF4230 domain-containing protein n=1 Tax=Acetoanaerobium sticklandii (strain ATCC 12662 / DSM 519 / JCM 1433 / CCUG 9281 / NCIMB 10654 / HF) TaxID=499177 RepID=E3PVG6_ACESD|nr:DUF4230 domain-containing protein [Acetoanaerobium sticklandii]CBH20533.1 exported protein of unknown function [Acetoanaerobium sticklandii]
MKKIYKTMLLMLIVILATISVTFFVTNKFHEQELYSVSGVLEQVKDISELNTVEMYFNEIIDFKNAKLFNNFQIPFTEKSFIFTVKSKVKAGVDLSSIDEGDIAISGKSLIIKLPNPKITSKEILSYKVYDEKNGLFNEVTTEDTLKALELFEKDIEKQALDSGIIEKSKENTKLIIRNLFLSYGFESIEIKWK